MKTSREGLIKFIAGVCATLFVISGTLALLFFNIEQKVFSAETYKTAFREQGVYENAPAVFTDLILRSLGESGDTASVLYVFTDDELELMISSLLPPEEFEHLMDDLLDSTIAFFDGETDSISISVLALKRNLVGEGGMRAVMQFLALQPECTADQLLEIGIGLLSVNNDVPKCNPPVEWMDIFLPMMETQLQSMTVDFPDEIVLVDSANTEAFIFREQLGRIRTLLQISPIISFLFLFIFTLLAVRSLHDLLKWWGAPFLILGVTNLLLGLIGTPVVRMILNEAILNSSGETPLSFLILLRNVTGAIVQLILRPTMIEGFILVLIGGGLLGGSVYIKRTGEV